MSKIDWIVLYEFRCVDDGYCSLEQADLIQQYVEKRLGKLYQIDETIGKSLLTMDDEEDEEDRKNRKAMIISDDEDSHLSSNGNQISGTAKHDNHVTLSPSLTSNNQLSPSPSKDNLSPGEITKTMSPSSLSEGSPILD